MIDRFSLPLILSSDQIPFGLMEQDDAGSR